MRKTLFQSTVFPLIERLWGTSIQDKLDFYNQSQWWKQEELAELQNEKLRPLIRYAYRYVPYYRRLFDEKGIEATDIKTMEDLEILPVLTKEDIRNNLNDLMAVNAPKNAMLEFHSSGSTGEPLKYYMNREAYSSGWAQAFRCWGWAGYRIGDPYVKISLNPRDKLIKKIQDRAMNCVYIHAADINERTLREYVERIEDSNASIVRGYASSMYLLAKQMEEAGNGGIKVNAVMTTGDNLFPHYRKTIESQFNCAVYDCYGGESTPVAFECEKHQGYHVCNESIVVEFRRGQSEASAGEMSEIVFTNLDNYVMPFIRYGIGDIGVPSGGSCECGRGLSLMKSVEGRDTDIVVTPCGNFLIAHFFTALFGRMKGIDQFQVLQDRIDELNVKIIKNDSFTEKDLLQVREEIEKRSGGDMKVGIELVDYIPPSKSGKRSFVMSTVPVDSVWN